MCMVIIFYRWTLSLSLPLSRSLTHSLITIVGACIGYCVQSIMLLSLHYLRYIPHLDRQHFNGGHKTIIRKWRADGAGAHLTTPSPFFSMHSRF
jgi:hypothetical protein